MITRYLYRNPRIVWLLLATIVIAGVSCLFVMPRLEDPVLRRRVGVITTTLHGADTNEIESTVTIPIEQWLNEFAEIRQVRSNTRSGISNVVIELEDRVTDPSAVWSSIENTLQSNRHRLPEDCNDPELTVFPLKAYAAIVAIVPGKDRTISVLQQRRLARELQSSLLQLKATQSVEIFGDPGEEILVRVRPEMLAATRLSPGAIAKQLADSQRVPSGDAEPGDMRVTVQVRQATDLMESLEQTGIHLPGVPMTDGASPVSLSEIATVSRQPQQPPRTAAIIDGVDAIVLGVMVDNDARVDLWADKFQQLALRFKQNFPGSYSIKPLFMQSEQIERRMRGLLQNLTLSGMAVVLLVFLLMGWRCMIVVAASLPLSACLVIVGLRLMSIPIHQMSVTGLIVALGLLIDNAIVMVEEVRSRVFEGKEPLKAITESIRQLGVPLFGSTLTTVLAFLPIAIMPGPSGEFVGSIAISVILAISASFLMAITIIPPLVFLLGVNSQRTSFLDYGLRIPPLQWLYRKSLSLACRFPLVAIAFTIILPIAGFRRATELQRQFFPASDRNQIQLEVELPAHATVPATRKTVNRVQTLLTAEDQIDHQHWFIGQSAPTFYYNVVPRRRGTPNYAQAFVDVRPGTQTTQLVDRLQEQIDGEIFDARVIVRKLEQGPPFDAPVEIRVLGNDVAMLQSLGQRLRKMLAALPAITHTRSDLGNTMPQWSFDPDPAALRDARLTYREVSRFLYSSLEGVSAGMFFQDGEQIPVRVQIDYSGRSLLPTLNALQVGPPMAAPSSAGPPVEARPTTAAIETEPAPSPALGSLGEIKLDSEVGAIIRLNGERVNEVKAYLKAGVLPSSVVDELDRTLSSGDFLLPDGYHLEWGGEAEKRSQAVSTLIANASVLLAVMLLTLVATQGSFRAAAVIAAVGFLAMGLGPLTLYSFGYPFGFMAIVGTMGLVGVAINDSIVVLAAIRSNERLDGGSGETLQTNAGSLPAENQIAGNDVSDPLPVEDVVYGCTRHILTTTLTTMIGFLPLVLDGGQFWPPLAIVISSGVAAATLLALYFVPALHTLLKRYRRS